MKTDDLLVILLPQFWHTTSKHNHKKHLHCSVGAETEATTVLAANSYKEIILNRYMESEIDCQVFCYLCSYVYIYEEEAVSTRILTDENWWFVSDAAFAPYHLKESEIYPNHSVQTGC